jgi:hypothetical protein
MVRRAVVLLHVILSLGLTRAAEAAGAYAVGRSAHGSWGGGAINAATFGDAAREALMHCAARGPNCSIIAYFSRKCFSLAIPPGTGRYYWATRDNVTDARYAAVSYCLGSGQRCEAKVAVCDTREVEAQSIRRAAPPTPQIVVPKADPLVMPFDPDLVVLILLATLGIAFVTVALRMQSFREESDCFDLKLSADDCDNEAARFRAMSRKLDAETELAECFIKAKRTQAELSDNEELGA